MKRPILALLLIFLAWSLPAQDRTYPTLSELGWEPVNFKIPENLSETDTGSVSYMITLNHDGKVAKLKLVKNSFEKETEKIWRHAVQTSTFVRKRLTVSAGYKGTFQIARAYCSPPVQAVQRGPFRKKE